MLEIQDFNLVGDCAPLLVMIISSNVVEIILSMCFDNNEVTDVVVHASLFWKRKQQLENCSFGASKHTRQEQANSILDS
uniref:Uncharacterized protein n=1 Tax=Kalanchoe fedtschenkoi TaxID=63787 RepID=A0A7N1A4U4_KALFE